MYSVEWPCIGDDCRRVVVTFGLFHSHKPPATQTARSLYDLQETRAVPHIQHLCGVAVQVMFPFEVGDLLYNDTGSHKSVNAAQHPPLASPLTLQRSALTFSSVFLPKQTRPLSTSSQGLAGSDLHS